MYVRTGVPRLSGPSSPADTTDTTICEVKNKQVSNAQDAHKGYFATIRRGWQVAGREQGAVIRVFVIDDTSEMRTMLEQILTLDEFAVVGLAANGAEALPLMAEANPDVVVIDYKMPGLDGLTTARLVLEERPRQAIILYTAYLDADLERKAAKAGVALCVEKAAGILTLERDIRRLAEQGS
jgi:CheY-like chemotaxis protein